MLTLGPVCQELQTHPLQPGRVFEGWRVASPRQARLSDNLHIAPKRIAQWASGGAKGPRESQICPKSLLMASPSEDGPFLLRVRVFFTSIPRLPAPLQPPSRQRPIGSGPWQGPSSSPSETWKPGYLSGCLRRRPRSLVKEITEGKN